MTEVVSKAISTYPGRTVTNSRSRSADADVYELFLLFAAISVFPLENVIPSIGGISASFIVFVLIAGYVSIFRPGVLLKTLGHRLFLVAFGLLFIGLAIESLHPHASFTDLVRIAQMVLGAALIATVCRGRRAIWACLIAFVTTGVWMSVILIKNMYGGLNKASATDFNQASQLRAEVLAGNSLAANANEMAFITGLGVIVALVLALNAKTSLRRCLFFLVTGFATIATFLPLSRGGIGITILCCALILLRHRGKKVQILVGGAVLVLVISLWVPSAVFSRLTFTTDTNQGRQEARAQVYTAAVQHLPDYVVTGVGAGNFWRLWGYNNGWAGGHGVVGAHNCFIQVTIYWGLLGFLFLVLLVHAAYKAIPRFDRNDVLVVGLQGISMALFLHMMVTHNLYAKEFSVGIGMLVGADRWLGPDSRASLNSSG